MKYKKIQAVLMSILAVWAMTGCQGNGGSKAEDVSNDPGAEEHAAVSTVTLTEGKYSEEKLTDTWDEESAVYLKLEKDQISIDEEPDARITDARGDTKQDTGKEKEAGGVRIASGTVTITQEGTYIFSGELADGQIVVDADKDETVRLVLNGVSVASSHLAPLYSKGGNVIVTLVEGTENSFEDANVYSYENEGDDEPDAAVFAEDDLTFNGTGTLNVTGNYNHAIHCKDDLKFITGTYVISAADDGIVGKDSVSFKNGNFTIKSGDDGIKATNIEETDKGYVLIEEGAFQITAGGDGIQAETLLRINDGELDIETGGGSENADTASGMREEMPEGVELPDGELKEMESPEEMPEGMVPPEEMPKETKSQEAADSASAKALKSYVDLIVAGGEFELDCCDDAIHSNQNVVVEDGTFSIRTGDDGIHADQKLKINEGDIDIVQSYEGLEGYEIEIDGGNIRITASDDGINAASGEEEDSQSDGRDGEQQPGGRVGDIQEQRPGGQAGDGREQRPGGQVGDVQDGEQQSGGQVGDVQEGKQQSGGQVGDVQEGEQQPGGQDEEGHPGGPKEGGRPEGLGTEGKPGGPKEGEWPEGLGGEGQPGDPEEGGRTARPDKGFALEEDQGAVMTFNGGNIFVNAGGDGLDANGDIFINGGEITVCGPVDGGNGTLDYASACKITGGTFFGAGSMGMAQSPSEDSTQPTIVWSIDDAVKAQTVISVLDANGEKIAEMTTEKAAQWFAVSSPKLETGGTYTVCAGDKRKEVEISQTVGK